MSSTAEGLETLVERAAALAGRGSRRVLGIAGPPGAGKSTLADALAAGLAARGHRVVVVPMDGFHLAQAELERLGRADRKGAPDTFDAAGFVALLRRITRPGADAVYAPAFDRALEEPIAGAIAVEAETALVIVEGNYLLLEDAPWSEAAALLDETWYVRIDAVVRVERLVARHRRFGRDERAARDFVATSDERNAELVARSAERADLIVNMGMG
ncbi:nucleoside/nucleotide kinase family protein [Demequina sp. TTPB684]|uniref:nucleoside/nucleotide kinase family protein n=1 Tax=unclassified Demequina TaxID=2620311 RepID=UPI001CF5E321|nr:MULTISPECIES: nucleoside/nucleotide kinase family protein [unclassified Demequina]MCB2413055.1 nucleoside/nucleotide kinase family protein [Demequina sp. TTPB684]UPU88136.1 nucleoside/nucleotide kinase family protein [Demequina sp. TMPB413]